MSITLRKEPEILRVEELVSFQGDFSCIFRGQERERLDHWLSTLTNGVSRNFWTKALSLELIFVNGLVQKKNYQLKVGDRVHFDYYKIYLKLTGKDLRIRIPYKLLYDSPQFCIVDKPSGYLIHRVGFIDHSVMGQVSQDLKTPTFTVHRLDKFTSGICVIAKDAVSADAIQDLIRKGEIRKYYVAASDRRLLGDSGIFEQPIGEDDPRIHKKKQKIDYENGLSAKTRWRFLKFSRFTGLYYYFIRIFTGRQHQIRVHFQHAGASVCNDELYAYDDYSKFPPMYNYSEVNLGLHALRIRFFNPFEKKWLCITSWPKREPFQGLYSNFCDDLESDSEGSLLC